MKVVTSFATLMKLASELGKARLSGDEERIHVAKENHDAYKELCLKSDEMMLNCNLNTIR